VVTGKTKRKSRALEKGYVFLREKEVHDLRELYKEAERALLGKKGKSKGGKGMRIKNIPP